jgi:hypothetical protein
MGKELPVAWLCELSRNYLEKLRDNRCPVRNSEPRPAEYEAVMLPTWPEELSWTR